MQLQRKYVNRMNSNNVKFIYYLIMPLIGILAWFLPEFLLGKFSDYSSRFYKEFIENLVLLPTVIILILFGYIWGFLRPDLSICYSFLFIIFLPIFTLFDMLLNSNSSHNLLPFELAGYVLMGLPSAFGIYLSKNFTKKKFQLWRRKK
jgi:hypothetical protein